LNCTPIATNTENRVDGVTSRSQSPPISVW
jgi:hypothetical protein